MKLQEIISEKECYVYSTAYRFCISQFAAAPSTTIGPLDGDISKAVNITWKRKDRNLLPLLLHRQACDVARTWGLDRLHRLAVLTFAWTGGRPREALEIVADGAKEAGDPFPFSADMRASMLSFVPSKWPSRKQLDEARAKWSRRAVYGRGRIKETPGEKQRLMDFLKVERFEIFKRVHQKLPEQLRNQDEINRAIAEQINYATASSQFEGDDEEMRRKLKALSDQLLQNGANEAANEIVKAVNSRSYFVALAEDIAR
jgi:hypothetical protein